MNGVSRSGKGNFGHVIFRMGADLQKELAAALHDPENEKKMKKVFKHADKDKSGALDKAEFVALGKVIFKVCNTNVFGTQTARLMSKMPKRK